LKGYSFEVHVARFYSGSFGEAGKESYRVMGSGRSVNATISKDSGRVLVSDAVGVLDFLPFQLLTECKSRTPSSKKIVFPLEKDWLDKNRDRAEKLGMLSVVAIKFKRQRKDKRIKEYEFSKNDLNVVHYIVPERHLKKLLDCVQKNEVFNLSEVSTDDLIGEIRKRCQNSED